MGNVPTAKNSHKRSNPTCSDINLSTLLLLLLLLVVVVVVAVGSFVKSIFLCPFFGRWRSTSGRIWRQSRRKNSDRDVPPWHSFGRRLWRFNNGWIMGHLPCDFEEFWGSLAPYLGKQNHPWRPLSLPPISHGFTIYMTPTSCTIFWRKSTKICSPPKKIGWPAQVKSVQHFCGSNLKKLSGPRISVVPHRRYLHHPSCERFFHKGGFYIHLNHSKGASMTEGSLLWKRRKKWILGRLFFWVDDSRSF